jgi:hypothetical protein
MANVSSHGKKFRAFSVHSGRTEQKPKTVDKEKQKAKRRKPESAKDTDARGQTERNSREALGGALDAVSVLRVALKRDINKSISRVTLSLALPCECC